MGIQRFCAALASAAFALAGAAGTASALAFTLDAPVVLDASWTGNPTSNGLVLGTLNPVVDGFGNADTSGSGSLGLTDGLIDFALYDVFVVDMTITSAVAVDALGVSVGVSPFSAPVGGGAFDDGGLPLIDPTSVANNAGGFTFRVDFGFGPNTVDSGETTVRLFAMYPLGSMDVDQTATFMVSSGTNFTAQGTIVPEPGTALLVGTGLALLGVTVRRRAAFTS